ncbi:MAG: STAS domain-containing protein [Butyrivibrio sp.]|nr:STAS domain-containing protein [Butyrivibrio sp.]
MTITKTINGNEATLEFEGWLDTQASPELIKELDEIGEDVHSLIFDFTKLEYISSSGVRALVGAYKKVNGALVVKGASDGIMSIVKATGIDKRIRFE